MNHAQGGQYTGPFSWDSRRFSVAELKRLQTIPDAYEIVGNRQVCIEQIGNSVPPQLGRILALSILEQVMGVKLPFPMRYLPFSKQLGFRKRKRQLTEIYAQKAKVAQALLAVNCENLGITESVALTSSPTYVSHEPSVRFLSTDLGWTENKVSNSIKLNLKYDLNNSSWLICGQTGEIWNEENENAYIIDISPSRSYKDWVLGTDSVKLCAKDLDQHVFIALWKAFEEKLLQVTGMADLVQLSGYYQYKPRISVRLTFHSDLKITPFWCVVQCVVSGIGVASQLAEQELALLWGVKAEYVFTYLQSLRSMGYEVRNHNTNPQISKGEYLIPYAFPTLTPRSVQLRKTLGQGND